QKDRLSTSLPDEIIHDILGRLLRSVPKQALQVYKLTLLSKRWTQIWLSYPNLEFEQDYLGPTEPQERFATAILDKFSGAVISMNTIRIKIVRYTDFYSKFIDRVLGLVADKFSPREIDIEFGSLFYHIYEPFIPESFFSSSNGGRQFLGRLSVLSFKHFDFGLYKKNNLNVLGTSLKVLVLNAVRFRNVWILNTMIAGAPLLDTLTLTAVKNLDTIRVRNHPNLRVIEVYDTGMNGFEIIGARSLENLILTRTWVDDLQISSTPILKLLSIEDGWIMTVEALNKLIAKLPSLESLTLIGIRKVSKLEIVNNDVLREIITKDMSTSFHIHPPRLTLTNVSS
ncbi:hypothetical protein LINPERPRIM_LOCUS35508, partial [Linum perenne]